MRAALVTSLPGDRLELRDVPEPTIGAGDLLVEVSRCGICGTDLHILDGHAYRPELPFVLGHEAVGRVVATGSEGDRRWLGQRVTMSNFVGDGTCQLCRDGDERLCRHLVSVSGVLGVWGGFAERMAVRAEQVVPVPEALDDDAVATLVDAGASAANSVRTAELRAGEVVTVVGGGPLGFLAAELARTAGAEVSVVQSSEARRRMIADMGYTVYASISELGSESDVVIDAAGAPSVLPWALGTLAPKGRFVAAAYGPVDPLDLTPASRKELTIRGIRSGRKDDLMHVMDLAASGDVRLPPIHTWRLEDIAGAIAALRAREVPGKAVIDVSS